MHQREGVYVNPGGFIYAIGAEGSPHIKIGKTTGPVVKRLAALQVGYPARLHIRTAVPVEQDLGRIEKAIHRFLATDRQQGEWFAVQVDQDQLEALIVRAVQWLAAQDARPGARKESIPGLAQRIQALRMKRGLSVQELAKRVEISRQQLHMIETNKTLDPGALTVLRIADALGVRTDYLLKGKRKTRRLTDDVEHIPTLPGMALETV
jgi:DNA-binding XRE family transcriptional regulator